MKIVAKENTIKKNSEYKNVIAKIELQDKELEVVVVDVIGVIKAEKDNENEKDKDKINDDKEEETLKEKLNN